MINEECYTVNELAKRLKKSPQFIRREIRSGALRAVTVGSEYRIFESAITEWLESLVSDGPIECRDPRRGARPKNQSS